MSLRYLRHARTFDTERVILQLESTLWQQTFIVFVQVSQIAKNVLVIDHDIFDTYFVINREYEHSVTCASVCVCVDRSDTFCLKQSYIRLDFIVTFFFFFSFFFHFTGRVMNRLVKSHRHAHTQRIL